VKKFFVSFAPFHCAKCRYNPFISKYRAFSIRLSFIVFNNVFFTHFHFLGLDTIESISSSFSSRALNLRDMMRRATQAAARNMEV
jgi:hypothetical protein